MNTVRNRILAPSIAFALLVAATAAWADTPIDETRALDPNGRIEIDNLKGRIDVEAWDRAEVRITGSLGEGVEKLEIDGDNRSLSVRVKYPRRGGLGFLSGDNTGPTRLHVMVPLRADLEIDSVAADIDVVGVAPAEVSIDSVSGNVVLVGAPRELSVETVSGDLRVTSNSRDVDIASVSGDIRLAGRLDGKVDLETVSGDAVIEVHESLVRSVSATSVSGDLELRAALAAGGEISMESVSGDVDLRLPANLSAEVRGESFSGDLVAPDARIERPRHGPGASFRHRYGSGDGEISVETFSGDARLRLD